MNVFEMCTAAGITSNVSHIRDNKDSSAVIIGYAKAGHYLSVDTRITYRVYYANDAAIYTYTLSYLYDMLKWEPQHTKTDLTEDEMINVLRETFKGGTNEDPH